MSTQILDASSGDDEDLIDLRELIAVFRRRLRSLVGVGAIAFALVTLVTFQMTPLYTATGTVMIDPRQSQVIDFEAVMSGLSPDSAVVDTEVGIIASRSLAEAVVIHLDLVGDPEFNSSLQTVTGLSAVLLNIKSFVSSLVPTQVIPDFSEVDQTQYDQDRTIGAVLENLSVRRSGLTYIIDISFASENPRKAAQIANAFAELYLRSQLEAKFDATERANDWLNERVGDLREEVRIAELVVESFRAEHGLFDAVGFSLNEQQISDVNAQLVVQRQGLAEARARLEGVTSALARGESADTIGEVLSSDVIRDLRQQQAEISRRTGELSSRYGARHPEILTVQREAADIEAQIGLEIQRIVTGLRNAEAIERRRVASLVASLATMRSELVQDNSAMVTLRELERDAESGRALFEAFLNRFRQTTQQESLTDADARIVSRASIPSVQSSPNVMLNLALGIVLGGIAGVGVIFLLEMFDTGLRTEDDTQKKLHLPHMASIGALSRRELSKLSVKDGRLPSYIAEKPLSVFAEAFRNLRASIKLSDLDAAPKVIAITSALPGEGKTTTAHCLGLVSALANSKTIVIDCDLRRLQLTHSFGIKAQFGLLEVLAGEAKLESALIKDDQNGLTILPLADAVSSPRDVFGTVAFERLLAKLRDQFDLVILDTAPVLAVTDTRTISTKVDGTVFVVKWRKTAAVTASRAIEELQHSNGRVLGVVISQVDMKKQSLYGYAASGYYHQAYQGYYTD